MPSLSPYSFAIPGATKASVVGFMTSMVTAAASTTNRATCVGRIFASSRARTLIRDT